MQKIIVVTGTPGSGKTALAKLIAAKTRSKFLNLGELIRREKLYRKYDRSRRSYIIDTRKLRARLLRIYRSNAATLVLETNWLGSFMPKSPGMRAIVVRTDPTLLARRLKSRGWSRKKIWENVEAELIDLSLYESVKLLGKKSVYQIDSTNRSLKQMMASASGFLSGSRRWDGSTPNWLARYDPLDLRRDIL